MPLYEYVCPEDRQRFEKLRPMSEGASATCPTCGSTSPRVISMMAARVGVGVGADSYASAPSASASCSCGSAGCC